MIRTKLSILLASVSIALLSGCTDQKAEAEKKAKEEARAKFIEEEIKAEEAMMKKVRSIPFRSKYKEIDWSVCGDAADPKSD